MESLVIKRNSPEMITLWTERISECKASGKTALVWCEENGINVKTYYYWHNKIRKMVENQSPSFYEVPKTQSSVSGNPEATIKINGINVDVYSGASIETLSSIFAALKIC